MVQVTFTFYLLQMRKTTDQFLKQLSLSKPKQQIVKDFFSYANIKVVKGCDYRHDTDEEGTHYRDLAYDYAEYRSDSHRRYLRNQKPAFQNLIDDVLEQVGLKREKPIPRQSQFIYYFRVLVTVMRKFELYVKRK